MRDVRWENVFASVGRPTGYLYEDEDSRVNPDDYVEFLIEVFYAETIWYNRIVTHEEELATTYNFILDKMVEIIDQNLDTAKG